MRIVRELPVDGLHHAVRLAANRHRALEVFIDERVERAEQHSPTTLPLSQQRLARGRRINKFAVAVAIGLFAVGQLLLEGAPKSILPKTEYDTGPPSAGYFVGTVLRRALRENAPPLLS